MPLRRIPVPTLAVVSRAYRMAYVAVAISAHSNNVPCPSAEAYDELARGSDGEYRQSPHDGFWSVSRASLFNGPALSVGVRIAWPRGGSVQMHPSSSSAGVLKLLQLIMLRPTSQVFRAAATRMPGEHVHVIAGCPVSDVRLGAQTS